MRKKFKPWLSSSPKRSTTKTSNCARHALRRFRAYSSFETYLPRSDMANRHGTYQKFSAPVYALDTFLPIINLGQKDRWMPNPHLVSCHRKELNK